MGVIKVAGDNDEFEITPRKLNVEPLSQNFYVQNQQIKKTIKQKDGLNILKNKIPQKSF